VSCICNSQYCCFEWRSESLDELGPYYCWILSVCFS
jgi:hypothetical protein